jgi:hypothetical protein
LNPAQGQVRAAFLADQEVAAAVSRHAAKEGGEREHDRLGGLGFSHGVSTRS